MNLHKSAVPANLRFDLFLLWKSSNASWDSRDLPQSPPPHEAWAKCSMHTNSRIGRRNAHDTLSGRRIQASRLSVDDYRVCAAIPVANQQHPVCILYLPRSAYWATRVLLNALSVSRQSLLQLGTWRIGPTERSPQDKTDYCTAPDRRRVSQGPTEWHVANVSHSWWQGAYVSCV